MRLPALYVIFRLAAGAIEFLIEPPPPAVAQTGDNEAGVRPLRPDLDARNDPLGPAPASGGVIEFLEAPNLGRGTGGEPGGGARLQVKDMTPQRAGRGETEHIVQAVG